MGFKGFLKKTISITGKVALVTGAAAGLAAYYAGKFIFSMIKDNGMSTVNRSILSSTKNLDLTKEEAEIVREAEALQDKTDRARNKHNSLVKKVDDIKKMLEIYDKIDEINNQLDSAELTEEQRNLFQNELKEQQEELKNLRGDDLGLGNPTSLQERLEIIAPEVEEARAQYDELNSELKVKMSEVREVVRSRKEKKENHSNI